MALLFDDVDVIRSITLPQTEPTQPRKQFQFFYNSDAPQDVINLSWRGDCSSPFVTQTSVSHGWGSLSEMDTPDGARVKYSYLFDGDSSLPRSFTGAKHAAGEPITQKQVIHDGVIDTWTYSIAQGAGANGGSVTGPDGSVTAENFYGHDPSLPSGYGGIDGKGGLVYKTTRSNKQIIERHWTPMRFDGGDSSNPNGLAPFNPVVDTEYTTLLDPSGNPSKMSAKTMQYDFNGNLISETDYDWFDPATVTRDPNTQNLPTGVPAGAVALRTMTNSYYNPATTSASTNYAKRDLATVTPQIVNAPKEAIVGASDTQLSYDGQPYGTAPTIGHVTNEARSDSPGHFINTTHAYDATYGNLTSTTDPRGNATQYFYEDLTHALLTRIVVDPNNQVTGDELTTQIAYDYYTGLVMSQTDPNQKTTSTVYTNQLLGTVDPFGRPGIVTDPQGRKAVTRYFDNARQVEVWSDLNSPSDALLKSRASHDQLGRLVKTESTEDGVNYTIFADNVYQQMGRITISTNPMRTAGATTDGWTRTTRDDLGRVVTVETLNGRYPQGTSTGVVSTSYNANATTVTDQAGKVRRSIADGLGRLLRVDEPDSTGNLGSVSAPVQATNYTYDSRGNLTQVQQGTQPARNFVYDALSGLKQANNPESGTITYTYDDNSNLQTKTDARGVITTYAYEGLNRVITRTFSGAAPGPTTPGVTYGYDAVGVANSKGRLTSVSSSVSSYSYGSYDVMGRVLTGTQTTDWQNYGMSYQYNLAGGMTSETYPSNKVVVTEYDTAGRISGVKRQATEMYYAGGSVGSGGMQYAAHGAVKAMRLGNGRWERTSFNSRLQPTQITVDANVSGSNTLQLDYGYGTATTNNGNVMLQTITVPNPGGGAAITMTQNYTYDALNRLASASENGGSSWAQTYDYDRFGNRAVRSASYLPTPRQTPVSNSPADLAVLFDQGKNRITATSEYGYDAAGNLTSMPNKNLNSDGMTYDAENRQKSYTAAGAGTTTYTYDGDGRRVKKTDPNNNVTVFVYNVAGQLIAEYTTGTPPAGDISYLTTDHLGSTRVVTDSGGNVKARYDYVPFGEEIGSNIGARTVAMGYVGSGTTRQKFTQKERDNESGLDYFLARYYSSAQGRFTSPDEFTGGPDELFDFAQDASDNPTFYADLFEPQSLNKYQYAFNNPFRYVDPDGHQVPLDARSSQGMLEASRDIRNHLKAAWNSAVGFREKARRFLGTDRESNVRRAEKWGLTREQAEASADMAEAFNDSAAAGPTKGLRSARLFSGVTSRLESGLSNAIGREVSIGSGHVARRVIERVLTEGGALAGVTIKQLGKTLNKGEFYKDAVTGSFIAVRKNVAIAFVVDKSKVIIKTVENAGNIKEGERFTRVARPF